MQTKYILTTMLLVLSSVTHLLSASYIWTGTSSSNWNTAGNWSSGIIPGVADFITLNSNAPNNLVLDQNRTVANFTINGDTLDLGTYTLTTTGVTYFNGGLVSNGNLNISGSLCHFGGATINARIEASCGYYHMNGGLFLKPVVLVSSGTSNTTGTGNCTFEDSLTITHSGVFYFTMGSSTNDFFNGPVTITNHASKEVYLANGDTSFYNANVTISSTGNGGVAFGNGGGVSVLASGKTISIGSGGFGADYLTLKKLKQLGTTAQTLTLTGTAIVNLVGCEFNGNLTLSAGGFLLKDDVFNSATTFTKTGTANCHSDGNNTYNGATSFANNGSSGRLRLSATEADVYSDHVSFNSTGQDVQVCYTGNNYFYKNVTSNSNKVVFNTSTGKVTLAGDTAQSLNGSYNYAFKKLAINKSANQVTANTTLSVDDTLFFVSGNLITTTTNLLTMKAGSIANGASSNSFVSGPVKKIGNTAFAYPVGRNTSYRPIEISAPSTTTSEFTGEYMEDSVSVNTSSRESTLGYLNRNNYWKLNRQVGTSQVYVTLSWDTLHALVDTFVTVANWNGTQWKDLGKGIVSGNRIIGSVQSTNAAQSYLEFSLSYWNINAIPGAPNCSDVQNESDLRYCLTFTTSGSVQVTNNIFVNSLDPNGLIQLPFPIQVGVTLEGKNGLTSPKWWELNCPLITTDHSAILIPNDNASRRSIYLFAMESGSTIQNLRIRGASCNSKDFNQSTLLSGGILVDQAGNYMLSTAIKNCEVSCFSQAGIWKRDSPKDLIIENCYIQKVKGRSDTGIGYGVWTQGVLLPLPQQGQVVNFKNTIFDDCKAAIDGQGDPINWTIENCSFSQFFSSEDINMHNNNLFRAYEPPNGTTAAISDYHLCYTPPNCTSANCYYGIKNTTPTSLPQPQCSTSHPNTEVFSYTNDWIHCTGSNPVLIPIYDVAGATTLIDGSIFHKKVVLSGQSNITLRFPNRDSSKGGVSTNNITISNTIFATDFLDPNSTELFNANNKGGYARVAQNYIESCVWSGSSGISSTYNFFSYKPGVALQGSNFYPSSMVLNLVNTSNVALPSTYTHSATPQHTFMQYVALNTSFKITTEPGIFGSQVLTYIIRPNPNKNIPSTVNNVISDQNYYYEGEIITDQTSTTIPGYNKPGLYGIDVMGFDVAPVSGDYNFKASAWQHIPVIVQGAAEKTLYFNIKDSYQETPITLTGVKKQAYLNGLLLWEEDIAVGGAGWEYVEVDLNTATILSALKTDGTENVLSFSIFMESGILSAAVSGLSVWVDDVYIPKTGSATGDNLIKDGSCELQVGPLCEDCHWFENLTNFNFGPCGSTDVGINGFDKKSGSKSLYLQLPFNEDCNTYSSVDPAGEIVASVGTNIDFTDLLSCNDYWKANTTPPAYGTSAVGFIPFPGIGSVSPGGKYFVANDITISGSVTISGSSMVIEADKKITVTSTGQLTITANSSLNTHLFTCENMWEGIVVEPGGQLIIDGYITAGNGGSGRGTLIEGAKNAIVVDDGILKLRYAEFNHNYLSVLLKNDQDANSYIYGCKFNCIGGMIAKEPFMEHFPFEHIRLENVKNIEFPIGTSTLNTGSKNYFSEAFSAIGIYKSSAKIQRNYFDNIYNHNSFYHSSSYGQAINVVGSRSTIPLVVKIGGTGINEANYFTNTNIGVRVSNANSIAQITIAGNEFENADLPEIGISSDFYNTAITIQSPTLVNLNEVEVFGNTITDNRIGIHANNISNISIGSQPGLIEPNIITFAQTSFNDYHHGIWLEDCDGAKVQDNEITQSSTAIPSGSYTVEGITIDECQNAFINLNDIDELQTPIHVISNCDDTELHCNDIINNTNAGSGVFLNFAKLPEQGDVASNVSWDNTWEGYGTVYGLNGNVISQLDWPWDDSDQKYNPNPDPSSGLIFATPLTGPTSFGCAVAAAPDDPDRDLRYGPVVDDTLSFADFEQEFTYKSKQYLFHLIQADSTLLVKYTSKDTLFSNFKINIAQTNIGKFYKVDSLMSVGDLAAAETLNSSITDTNQIETNLKTVNGLLINKVLKDSILNSNDTLTLEEIAWQNPITGGKAVFMARALLFLEIHSENYASRMGSVNITSAIDENIVLNHFSLAPNPANILCSVYFENMKSDFILSVKNMLSQTLFKTKLSANTQTLVIPIASFDEGVYLVTINDNIKIHELKKLIIVR